MCVLAHPRTLRGLAKCAELQRAHRGERFYAAEENQIVGPNMQIRRQVERRDAYEGLICNMQFAKPQRQTTQTTHGLRRILQQIFRPTAFPPPPPPPPHTVLALFSRPGCCTGHSPRRARALSSVQALLWRAKFSCRSSAQPHLANRYRGVRTGMHRERHPLDSLAQDHAICQAPPANPTHAGHVSGLHTRPGSWGEGWGRGTMARTKRYA